MQSLNDRRNERVILSLPRLLLSGALAVRRSRTLRGSNDSFGESFGAVSCSKQAERVSAPGGHGATQTIEDSIFQNFKKAAIVSLSIFFSTK